MVNLQKNNKYSGNGTLNFKKLLLGMISFIMTASGIFLFGCDTNENIVPTTTITQTVDVKGTPNITATPTVVPTATPSPTPSATPIPMEEQLKMLMSEDNYLNAKEYNAFSSNIFYVHYLVDGVDKYNLFMSMSFSDDYSRTNMVDLFSGYVIFSTLLDNNTISDMYGGKKSPDISDFDVYPESYQGKDVSICEFGYFGDFLNNLPDKDQRDYKGAVITSGIGESVDLATLQSYALMYLYALKDSEKVFLDDLKPAKEYESVAKGLN